MNILVINSGSSSIKYQLFKMPVEKPVCTGLVERIGLENSIITHKIYLNQEEKIIKKTIDLSGHEEGLKEVAALLTDTQFGVIKKPGEMEAVGHRVVHGGETFCSYNHHYKESKRKDSKTISTCAIAQPGKLSGHRSSRKNIHKSKTGRSIRYGISSNTFDKRLLPTLFPHPFTQTST